LARKTVDGVDVVGPSFNPFTPFQLFLEKPMAPHKRSRQDSAASSSAPAAPTSRIDETYAAQLARHLAGLRKLRRFTDLKV
jgi:hypothetical protein